MAAVDATAVSPEELQAKAWEGFAEGNWQKDIDVRDFIQKNYTPYEGDESFLADATEMTTIWPWSASSASTTSTPTHRLASTHSAPATSTLRKSTMWLSVCRPTFLASAP